MAIEKTLNVSKRSGLGKGPNRRLRAEKVVPGVFYSRSGENIPVQVPALPMEKMYEEMGRTSVFNLAIDDNGNTVTHPVLVWDVQYHPYKKEFAHIDFYGVDLERPVKVKVAIEYTGTSVGVKLGGRLETYRDFLTLVSKPLDMPNKVVIDITNMKLNDTLRVADLQLPEGVKAAYDSNFAIVTVTSKTQEEADLGEGGEGGENTGEEAAS